MYPGSNDNEGEGSEDVTYEEEQAPQSTPPQRTSRRVVPQKPPQGTPQRSPPPARRAPHPANTPLPTKPPQTNPTNPYKEGTKKFLVAQRLIAGETDRGRLAREVGVSTHTIYTVSSDLRLHGYTLKVDIKKPQPVVSHVSHVSSPAPQESPQGDVSGTSAGEVPQEPPQTGEGESEEKYFPGDVPQGEIPPPVAGRRTPQGTPRRPPQAAGLSREDVVEIVEEAMKHVVEARA